MVSTQLWIRSGVVHQHILLFKKSPPSKPRLSTFPRYRVGTLRDYCANNKDLSPSYHSGIFSNGRERTKWHDGHPLFHFLSATKRLLTHSLLPLKRLLDLLQGWQGGV
jgi:hypothetical protein